MKIAKFIAIDPETRKREESQWEVTFHLLQPKQVFPNFDGKEDFVAKKVAFIIVNIRDVHGVRNEAHDAASPHIWHWLQGLRDTCKSPQPDLLEVDPNVTLVNLLPAGLKA